MAKQIAYVVTGGCYSDYHIEQVFLEKRKAELYCLAHKRWYRDDCEVEEYEISDDDIDGVVSYAKAVYMIGNDDGYQWEIVKEPIESATITEPLTQIVFVNPKIRQEI